MKDLPWLDYLSQENLKLNRHAFKLLTIKEFSAKLQKDERHISETKLNELNFTKIHITFM